MLSSSLVRYYFFRRRQQCQKELSGTAEEKPDGPRSASPKAKWRQAHDVTDWPTIPRPLDDAYFAG